MASDAPTPFTLDLDDLEEGVLYVLKNGSIREASPAETADLAAAIGSGR